MVGARFVVWAILAEEIWTVLFKEMIHEKKPR